MRAGFLQQACAGDERLQHEVDSLLPHEEAVAGLIEMPALHVAASFGGTHVDAPAITGGLIGPYPRDARSPSAITEQHDRPPAASDRRGPGFVPAVVSPHRERIRRADAETAPGRSWPRHSGLCFGY